MQKNWKAWARRGTAHSEMGNYAKAVDDTESAASLNPNDKVLQKDLQELRTKKWAWPVDNSVHSVRQYMENSNEVRELIAQFATVSGHSEQAVEDAVASDVLRAGQALLAHSDDELGLLMDARTDDQHIYAELAAIEIILMKQMVPTIQGNRADVAFYTSLELHADGGVSFPKPFLDDISDVFVALGGSAPNPKQARPDSETVTLNKQSFHHFALQLRLTAVHEQISMIEGENAALPGGLMTLLDRVLPKSAMSRHMDDIVGKGAPTVQKLEDDEEGCSSQPVQDAAEAFQAALLQVITEEQRAQYKADNGVDIAEAFWAPACSAGTGKCKTEQQLEKWVFEKFSEEQRACLQQTLVQTAELIKARRVEERESASLERFKWDVVNQVLSEEQKSYIKEAMARISTAVSDDEQAAFRTELTTWLAEYVTREQQCEIVKTAFTMKTEKVAVTLMFEQIERALNASEQAVLADIADESILAQHRKLIEIEEGMLKESVLDDGARTLMRNTHDQWLSKNLTSEQFVEFSARMEVEQGRHAKELIEQVCVVPKSERAQSLESQVVSMSVKDDCC